ncbi:multiple sugar transport system substrate-binding protein [Paenibacillus cellulosilyticus]|uniref:Multiple sugar transport system substrate-binding protein n=1 Tax=Paenibacillus cellulosilyticus TaxID=375489 RepID=A0A2V2YTI8_9BACL|nr:extracellular solute-binding protein [Paenibacillus cellulosilyticus]PWV98603.1 multiple sugar transport system substrate-binding protein [Paenibacillus cellulosilyticus]QKS43876.1 extracellular solute-binding protein [Paenibacillus cellulosilyticus]
MNRTVRRGCLRLWPAIAALALLFTGCASEPEAEEQTVNMQQMMKLEKPEGMTKLRIMSGDSDQQEQVSDFEEKYGVEIEWVPSGNGTINDILSALDSPNPPDLIEFDYSLIRDLIDYDVFEPLDLAPYDAKSVIGSYFPGLDMSYFRALDRQHIVFMPEILHAGVTYYRADLMKEYGYPDDPEALGNYMESPERWLAMAKRLKREGKRIMQRPTDLLQVLDLSNGYFNIDGSFTRDTSEFVSAVAIAKEANRLDLPLWSSIWDEEGQKAIRNGELIMFVNGEWGDSFLQSWAPDTYQLWRKTRLPLNQYGIITGWVSAIPKEARNKDLAWKFTQYQLQRKQGYLNTLDISKWYDKMNEVRRTPLDAAASAIWDRELSWRISTEISSDRIISIIESNIMSQLADRIDLLSPLNARR